MKHRLWVEMHYVVPIEWESEHEDRAEAIKEAQADSHEVCELLPDNDALIEVVVDGWTDVLDKRIDGIYERTYPSGGGTG